MSIPLTASTVSRLSKALRKRFKSPREALAALGLDEALLDVSMAFDRRGLVRGRDQEGPPPFSKSRCLAWMRRKGFSEQECDELLEQLAGVEAEDRRAKDRRAKDEHATSEVHNKMEMARHTTPHEAMHPETGGVLDRARGRPFDELPSYGRNLPRAAVEHAMDCALPRDAACAIAPGLKNVCLGVLGWC